MERREKKEEGKERGKGGGERYWISLPHFTLIVWKDVFTHDFSPTLYGGRYCNDLWHMPQSWTSVFGRGSMIKERKKMDKEERKRGSCMISKMRMPRIVRTERARGRQK